MPNIPENLREPFRLFIEELKSNLEVFQKALLTPISTAEEAEILRKKLEGRFHLVRGGAGFFNLKEIRDAATEGEEKMKKAKGSLETFQSFQKEELTRLVGILESQLSSIVSA